MQKPTSTVLTALGVLAAATAAYALRPRKAAARPFRGKVVLVTGGSRGLGFALAERFARADALLVLAARKPEELAQARDRLLVHGALASPDDCLLVPADLTDPAQAKHLIDRALDHFGRIDVLINNAGIIEVGPLEDQPLDAYTRAMNTNFFAALYTIHAALPHMLRRTAASPGQTSAIVTIASIGGKIPVPHLAPYVASKFALTGFSETLHAELRSKGIRVTTVCPGLMRTGGEEHVVFAGRQAREALWFKLAAKTPLIAASVTYAADKIFRAVAAGRAEITITPQAWLAARIHGIAPAATQAIAALANEYVLPAPAPASREGAPLPAV